MFGEEESSRACHWGRNPASYGQQAFQNKNTDGCLAPPRSWGGSEQVVGGQAGLRLIRGELQGQERFPGRQPSRFPGNGSDDSARGTGASQMDVGGVHAFVLQVLT